MSDVPTVLSFHDLHVTFRTDSGPVHAVRGISVEVRAGEVVALVGESGSGKSAAAMTALALLPPDATVGGSVRVRGQDLADLDPRALRRLRGKDVGMVFQEPTSALNPVLTIGDQLVEALEVHGVAYGRAARERAAELLRVVGVPEAERRLRQYPHELSGGQRQRVVIAVAVSCDPGVLVADEPTTALDVTVQAEILDLLRRLKDERGTGILLVTHDMGVVADLADRVAVMLDGEVVETGTAEDVLARPRHDYTRGLLAAVPRLGQGPGQLDGGGGGEHDGGRGSQPGTADVAAPVATRAVDAGTAEGHPAVDVRDLVVEYRVAGGRTFRAVDGVSFRIDPGEVVGLVGESGSGKSTIARCALGLVPAAQGVVSLFGQDLVHLRGRALRRSRRRVGVVFQDPAASLDPRMPVAESVAEPLHVHRVGDGASRRRRVGELLDAVELPSGVGGRYPHELSGGERQRVSMARALALQPDLLVLDEPTSSLDVSVQRSLLATFTRLQDHHGFACLFVSHDLAVVDMLAQRVVVLHDGRVVEQGDRAEILQQPREPYTRRLLAAAPVPDPGEQARRRASRQASQAPSVTTR